MQVPKWPLVWRSTLERMETRALDAESRLGVERGERVELERVLDLLDRLCLALDERGLPTPQRIEMCNDAVSYLCQRVQEGADLSRLYGGMPEGYHRLAFMGIQVSAGAAPGSVVLVPKEASHG